MGLSRRDTANETNLIWINYSLLFEWILAGIPCGNVPNKPTVGVVTDENSKLMYTT
jgi:hypothetical protein